MRYRLGYTQIVRTQGAELALQNSGLKATKPRIAVLEVLTKNRYPMTVEKIASKLEGTKSADVATIYRVLEIFEKSSIVKKINLDSGVAHYEISDAHHHHIICKDCGAIEELENCVIERMIPYSKSFPIIFDHSLEFFGRCKKCIKS